VLGREEIFDKEELVQRKDGSAGAISGTDEEPVASLGTNMLLAAGVLGHQSKRAALRY
jgi:hypothetical protein